MYQDQSQEQNSKLITFKPSFQDNFYSAFGQKYQIKKPILIKKDNNDIIPLFNKDSQIDRAPIYQVNEGCNQYVRNNLTVVRLYSFDTIIQSNQSKIKLINTIFPNTKLIYRQKLLNDVDYKNNLPNLSQEDVIEFIKVDDKFDENTHIQVVVLDQRQLIMNMKMNKNDKILSQIYNQLKISNEGNTQFYLFSDMTVITENQTFNDLFKFQNGCKLYLIQIQKIQLEKGQISVTIIMNGVVEKVKAFDINSEIVDSIQKELGTEVFIHSENDKLSKSPRAIFKYYFQKQSHCCIIVERKVSYYKNMIEILDHLKQEYKEQYERIKKQENLKDYEITDKITIQNSYYYEQLQQRFENHKLNSDIQNHFEQFKYYTLQPKYNQTEETIVSKKSLSQDDIENLTKKQIEIGTNNNQTNIITDVKGTMQSKICMICQKDIKDDIENDSHLIFKEGCEHFLHSKCYHEIIIQQLKDQLNTQDIKEKKEILFGCFNKKCNRIESLREFQNKFSLRRQFEIQNLFLSYIIEHSEYKFLQCANCLFIYIQDNNISPFCPQKCHLKGQK